MGPAEGAQGGERQHRRRLEPAQVLEGLVVEGRGLARHADLQRHLAFGLGLRVDVAALGPLGVAGLQHVEVFGAGEGQAVVEALLHQIHEGAGGQWRVVAVHHGRERPFGGLNRHGGAPQQAG